jgi:sugar lactone lactonase YvrE
MSATADPAMTATVAAPMPETVFTSPGPHPNGLQATAAGLWILDQQTHAAHLVSYTGEVLAELATGADRGSGITHDGAALWLASTYSREILRVDPATGATLARYPTPGAGQTGAHGLEWHDASLWIATPPAATIYQVDVSEGFQVVRFFPAPGSRPHGLAWDGDDLWCLETNHRALYHLDTQTGHVLRKLALPPDAPEPHGMTVWAGHFWYCDANTRAVCRVPLP